MVKKEVVGDARMLARPRTDAAALREKIPLAAANRSQDAGVAASSAGPAGASRSATEWHPGRICTANPCLAMLAPTLPRIGRRSPVRPPPAPR